MGDFDIKALRDALGLTQEELAQRLGVSRNTIINYEKGGVIPGSKRQILESLSDSLPLNKASHTSNISVPAEVWEVIKNQADSLKARDEQTSEVIAMLREQLKKGQNAEDQHRAAN